MFDDKQWWYLSFSFVEWLGASVVQADSIVEAIVEAHVRKINPGGAVMAIPCEKVPPLKYRNRLLSREDIEQWDAEVTES